MRRENMKWINFLFIIYFFLFFSISLSLTWYHYSLHLLIFSHHLLLPLSISRAPAKIRHQIYTWSTLTCYAWPCVETPMMGANEEEARTKWKLNNTHTLPLWVTVNKGAPKNKTKNDKKRKRVVMWALNSTNQTTILLVVLLVFIPTSSIRKPPAFPCPPDRQETLIEMMIRRLRMGMAHQGSFLNWVGGFWLGGGRIMVGVKLHHGWWWWWWVVEVVEEGIW